MGEAVSHRLLTSDDPAKPVHVVFVVDTLAKEQILRTAMQKQTRTYF